MSPSYSDRENSVHGGEPVECYRFTQGGKVYLWTSADSPITLPVGTFQPEITIRGKPEFSNEDSSGSIEIEVDRRNPIAALFASLPPSIPVAVTIYRAHRGDEANFIYLFRAGKVIRAKGGGSRKRLVCVTVAHRLTQKIPGASYQPQCNHVLYDEGCTVSESAFTDTITVTTVDGDVIQSSDIALKPVDWYLNGKFYLPNGEYRMVVEYVTASSIRVLAPFNELASLTQAKVTAGCNHLEDHCGAYDSVDNPAGRFDNIKNFYGFSNLPLLNPHERSVF